MNQSLFRRGISLMLSLATAASFAVSSRAAESDGLCPHHPGHTTDCGYEASGICTHQCTMDSGCITVRCSHTHVATCFDAQGNSLCSHACTATPACYAPITDCLHTRHSSCGHSDGTDCDFAVNGCEKCRNPVTELKGTDVVLTDGTEYIYTGSEIRPHVTVMVDRTVLVEKEHYTVSYAGNIGAGTGTVTVTGIESAGYRGTVILPFTIVKAPGTPEFTLAEIKDTDVTLEKTEFDYSGQPIEPAVTVTVNGTVLTRDKDYTVTYINNLAPGTGTLTVRGIATASENLGYFGKVTLDFTIRKTDAPETPENPTEPEIPSDPTTPSEPATPSEPTQPETESGTSDRKITKGSGSKWYKGSKKNLSFTVNADSADITAIHINGSPLGSSHYTLGRDGAVTLKSSWLEKQAPGTYRITIKFQDGTAEGKFTVAAAADTTNPQTGDTVILWAGAMILSLTGVAVLCIFRKKFLLR